MDLFLYLIFLVFHVLHEIEFLWLQLVDPVPHILSPLSETQMQQKV